MGTYKGGIPKLRFGTDLAPDQEPLGKPLFLVPLAADDRDRREPMAVLGNESKPKRDHLATTLAKRSTDNPVSIPPSAYAPDVINDEGTAVLMLHEDRWGNEIYRVDRTEVLDDEAPLPTWREPDTEPIDWDRHDAVVAEARRIAREVLGDAHVDAYEREQARKAAAAQPKPAPVAPAYAVTAKDEEAMEQRANTAKILAALGWPTRMAHAGPYGHTMAELADPTTADRDYW
jgi:hypothetical protein